MATKAPGTTSIEQAVEMREDADDRPSYYVHALLPVLLGIAGILIGVGLVLYYAPASASGVIDSAERVSGPVFNAAVGVIALGALAASVLAIVGVHRLIRRRNEHFARDRILRRGLIDRCRAIAQQAGNERATEHVEEMERVHNDALTHETHRPSGVHILLTLLVPLWYLHVVWFLLKDFPRHTARQARFVREARTVLDTAGQDPDQIPEIAPLEERSFVLSAGLILVFSAFGNLAVQWWMFHDPPRHFAAQREHEDVLLVQLCGHEGGQVARVTPPGDATEEASEAPAPDETDAGSEVAGDADEEPSFTVWACEECSKRYKVPPKRPVRVTCKACGHKSVLTE